MSNKIKWFKCLPAVEKHKPCRMANPTCIIHFLDCGCSNYGSLPASHACSDPTCHESSLVTIENMDPKNHKLVGQCLGLQSWARPTQSLDSRLDELSRSQSPWHTLTIFPLKTTQTSMCGQWNFRRKYWRGESEYREALTKYIYIKILKAAMMNGSTGLTKWFSEV